MSELFSLQGKIWSARRDAVTGKPSGHVWLGNVPEATLELVTETADKFESFSGNRLLYGSLPQTKQVNFNLHLDELLPESIALGLYADTTTVATGSVVDEVLPAGLANGDFVQLAKPFASAIVVKDGAAATLLLDTDYRITSANSGIIEILNIGTYVQPFEASYTNADTSLIVMFENATPPERYIVFDGINTVTGDRVVIDLYRVQFDPVQNFGLINEEWGGFDLAGKTLYDELNALDPLLGGFGRMQINKTYE